MFRLPLRLRSAPAARVARLPRRTLTTSASRLASSSSSSSTPAHKSLTAEDVAHFATFLPSSSILSTFAPINTPADDLEPFNTDWLGKYKGSSRCVLKPRSAEEVSRILKWCNEQGIAVVPQGGNTGLVGGGVPVRDEVILSLANMSQVRSFDPVSGVLVCDAGCILENLTNYLAPHKHIMPLDLGAKGSCHIGGNVATNAGGLRLLRYGSLHGSVLGLEVVLPDGSVMSELATLRKDNTGYDLKQLFIGSEGTLGIITGVAIATPAAPVATANMLLALPSFQHTSPVFQRTKSHLSEILSAFEYFDRESYDLVCHHTGQKALPDEEIGDAEAFVLIETSGGKREHDEAKLEDLLEALYSDADESSSSSSDSPSGPLIASGTQSQSTTQFAQLWAFRELLPEAASKAGRVYKYDVSVPVGKFKEVTDAVRGRLREVGVMRKEGEEGGEPKVVGVIGYGHFGDGNLHLNIIAEAYTPEIEAALEPYVYELVASHRGSISAEHGIGYMKTHALHYSKGEVSRAYMRKIKDVFDPKGILNPGKVVE